MGVYYYAYAVIGCEVTGKLYDEIEVRRCQCTPAPVSSKYCPECGSLAAPRSERTPRPYFDEDASVIGGLMVTFANDKKRAFAGLRACVTMNGDASLLSIPDPVMAFDAVRAELERFGLWNPASFGLWAVMNVSC